MASCNGQLSLKERAMYVTVVIGDDRVRSDHVNTYRDNNKRDSSRLGRGND